MRYNTVVMPKVFISHSSKDKDIILLFKDIILKTGIGLSDDEIFFTSSPETGVPVGENIPEYIKQNLHDCDYAFLMISENYKGSEICLNEMGAAMVLGKRLIPLVLYDYDFDKVGWLINHNLCARIDQEERLDEIRDMFVEKGMGTKTSVWNRARNKFIADLSPFEGKEEACEAYGVKGLLDYQIDIENQQKAYKENIDKLNTLISDGRDKVQNLIETHNASCDIHERKTLLNKLAKVLNTWADEMETLIPLVFTSLELSLKAVEGILMLPTVTSEEKDGWIREITLFQRQCVENKQTLEISRRVIFLQADMLTEQIYAKNKLLKRYDSLLEAYQNSIDRINDIAAGEYR